MRPITIWGLLILLEIGLYNLGPKENYELLSPQPRGIQVQARSEVVSEGIKVEMVDPAIVKISKFLKWYGVPEDFDAVVLVGVARRHGLRPDLLVLIGCVESSCGKYWNFNRFGWASDIRRFDLGNLEEEAEHIAGRIASMGHYQGWVNSDQLDLDDFAEKYNFPFRQSYAEKLKWFEEKIGSQ